MYIKNKRGPRIDHCGISDVMVSQLEHFPFKTILCFRFARKLLSKANRLLHIPLLSRLYRRPSCHTLSNAFQKSKKIERVSKLGTLSNAQCIF